MIERLIAVSLQQRWLVLLLAFGVVALASEDPKRFYPEMGTLYLARIGELVSHALWRFVTPLRERSG